VNIVLEAIERLLVGPGVSELDDAVLDLGNGRKFTERNSHDGVLIIGAKGSGKSSLLKTFIRGMLHHMYGGVVLAVKENVVHNLAEEMDKAGRKSDLIILGPDSGHRFNFFDGCKTVIDAATVCQAISDAISDRSQGDNADGTFWRAQSARIHRATYALVKMVHGRFDYKEAAKLWAGRANSLAELADPSWQASSPLAAALRQAKPMAKLNPDLALAIDLFEADFPAFGDRLQGSLSACVSMAYDELLRSPLVEMFSGTSTFAMKDLLDRSKVCAPGLAALDSTAGAITNAILQYSFCKAATDSPREHSSFLVSDECQFTVTRELMRAMTVLREYRVCTVLATQNIAVLDDRLGVNGREGLCALCETKIFCAQNHGATRQWASEQVGKVKRMISTVTRTSAQKIGQSSTKSVSEHEAWEDAVPPIHFAKLRNGAESVGNIVETILLKNGTYFRAKWHRLNPGRGGTVKPIL
jgi:type IV secretory pathway TraG/TraD family ATPase VirD4